MKKASLFARLLILVSIPALAGDWTQFRGPASDNISTETGLYRSWPAQGPKVLWKTNVCEGYAGAAIKEGRVYGVLSVSLQSQIFPREPAQVSAHSAIS